MLQFSCSGWEHRFQCVPFWVVLESCQHQKRNKYATVPPEHKGRIYNWITVRHSIIVPTTTASLSHTHPTHHSGSILFYSLNCFRTALSCHCLFQKLLFFFLNRGRNTRVHLVRRTLDKSTCISISNIRTFLRASQCLLSLHHFSPFPFFPFLLLSFPPPFSPNFMLCGKHFSTES